MGGVIKQKRQEKPLGEAGLSEERDQPLQAEEASSGGQSEERRHAFWNPEKGERDPLSLICSSIAGQPLVP